MNSVRKFRLEDLGVCNIGIKVAKLNMEIVSMLRHIFIPRFSIEDQERIYEHYWNGTDNVRIEIADLVTNEMNPLDSGTIYEYLIEGVLIEVPL